MNILELPIIYNLRYLVAGNQYLTQKFIRDNYKKYNCKNVLDLGCGTGDFSQLFKKSEYLGIDINPKYINFAKSKYGYNFECKDLEEFTSKDKFDAVIFISTLHHLSDTQVRNIFKKVVQITNKVIIIVDLNPETDVVRKFLIDNDRGEYVRTTDQKLKLIEKFGKVLELQHFNTRLASQSGLVLKPVK